MTKRKGNKISFKGWVNYLDIEVDRMLDEGRPAQQHEGDKLKAQTTLRKLKPQYAR